MSKDSSILSILNPFADNPPAPEFFQPFGDSRSAKKYNKKAFQVATLIPLYTLLGMGIRSAMKSNADELSSLEKAGPRATAMTSVSRPSSFDENGKKEAGDLLYQTVSTTVPLGAAIASLLVGMKNRDRQLEKASEEEYRKTVKDLEGQYNRVLKEKLYPKKASATEDLVAALGIMKYIAPVSLAIALTSGYGAKKYFDGISEQRKKAKKLKKGLEAQARINWVPKMELPEDDIKGDTTV